MLILPLKTPLLTEGDDLAAVLGKYSDLQDGDVVVVSSKAAATCEGTAIALQEIEVSGQAKEWAAKSGQDPRFAQAIIDETKRLNGRIIGACPGALLTELHPEGFPAGRLLVPNAGLDQSNIAEHFAIGWPRDPLRSVKNLRAGIDKVSKKRIAIIMSDSCCVPGRLGVTAFALTMSGIDPFISQVGKADLFGRTLRLTQEAVADQLATAANSVMGNGDQSTPAAIVRDHGFALSDFEGWVAGITPGEDLFREMFR